MMLARAASLLLIFLFGPRAMAQLVVGTTQSPSALVQNVLLGNGVAVSNVTFNGAPGNVLNDQIGDFDGTASNIGLGQGVLICTGAVQVALGPNNSDSWSEPVGTPVFSPDPDLEQIVGAGLTNDDAVLEFDFVPSGDSVSFRFVFASEEYTEFVCSDYNDVFGFFISGPGFTGPFQNGAENIALIPGTTVPIAINTLNNGVAGINGTPATCDAAYVGWTTTSGYFVDNANGPTVQFDGFTVPMIASAEVQCGETYHIKIAIADVFDDIYDSGVFLEGGSFTSSSLVSASLYAGGLLNNTLYEGCATGELELQRYGDLSIPDTVQLIVTGTAVNGVDLQPALPSQVIFPAGDSVVTFVLTAPLDPDALETVDLEIINDNICNGNPLSSTFSFFIDQAAPMTVDLADVTIGCADTTTLVPAIVAGSTTYDILWSTGATTPTLQVFPGTSTQYWVTVSDTCGIESVTDSAWVNIQNYAPIDLSITPDTLAGCLDTVDLQVVQLTGGDGDYTYTWSSGGLFLGSGTTLAVPADPGGTFQLLVEDGCGEQDSAVVSVGVQSFPPITLSITPDTLAGCLDTVDVQVVQLSGGDGNYSYAWTSAGVALGNGTSLSVPADPGGVFQLEVVDGCGASTQATVSVGLMSYPPLSVSASADSTVLCAGDDVEMAVLAVSGGAGGYSYGWTSNGAALGNDSTQLVSVSDTTLYQVTVTDICGAQASDQVQLNIPFYAPLSLVAGPDTLICPGDEVVLSAEPSGGAGGYSLWWPDVGSADPQIDVFPMQTTTFLVEVTDQCGVMTQEDVTVEVEDVSAGIDLGYGDEFEITAQSVSSPNTVDFLWDMGDGTLYQGANVAHAYADLEDHLVQLVVVSDIGCLDTATVLVVPPAHLYIPNAFTPDGDGVNDVFLPMGNDLFELELRIYDRWGELIFESGGGELAWNGELNGTPVQNGVYIYQVRAAGLRFGPVERVGHVTLLR